MQSSTFGFKVLLNADASTTRFADIVRETTRNSLHDSPILYIGSCAIDKPVKTICKQTKVFLCT